MSTAIDSNVLIALWNEDDTLNTQARSALDTALARGGLVIAAPVFAELLAAPSRTESFLDSFCKETGIVVDWNFNEATWRGWVAPSNSTLLAAEGSGTPARAAFLPIS
jgi:predicted nucleic acid-binding protein